MFGFVIRFGFIHVVLLFCCFVFCFVVLWFFLFGLLVVCGFWRCLCLVGLFRFCFWGFVGLGVVFCFGFALWFWVGVSFFVRSSLCLLCWVGVGWGLFGDLFICFDLFLFVLGSCWFCCWSCYVVGLLCLGFLCLLCLGWVMLMFIGVSVCCLLFVVLVWG